MQLMQLYATMLQLYATMLQLYATYAIICKYATICNYMQICNLSNYMQLYATNATYATILQQFRMQLYATMQLIMFFSDNMQLYATLCNNETICNYIATICNCVGTKNIYWHDNLSSCFNECRYHQIGICQIYIPRVMIKIY